MDTLSHNWPGLTRFVLQGLDRKWDRVGISFDEPLSFPLALAAFLTCMHLTHALPACISSIWSTVYSSSEGSLEANQYAFENPHVQQAPNPATFHFIFSPGVKGGGSWVIFGYSMTRLACCLILLGLSVVSLCNYEEEPEVFVTLTYLYCSILAISSMAFKHWTTYATRFNTLVLLSSLAVYIYKDIWPLATYTESPKDLPREGNILWLKLAVLVVASVCVPLFIPRSYVPVDPKNPMPFPIAEQTCSIFSLMFYFHLDPIIFLGYRVPHLKSDQLPPSPDSDYVKNLLSKHFPNIDPYKGAKRRHLFFGLLKSFRREYTLLALSNVGQSLSAFFHPVAINRILNYLETGGNQASIRPWFWILFMFLGPTFTAILSQWYNYIASRTMVHIQALITQLVFEHSLRIRFVAEVSDDLKQSENVASEVQGASPSKNDDSGSNTVAASSSAASIDGGSNENANDAGKSSPAPRTLSKGKGKEISTPLANAQPTKGMPPKKDSNLIGKINNLATTDLINIIDGVDFIELILIIPLKIGLSTFFLYRILGWSTFVGIGVMTALLPVPGYAAKLLQDVQKKRMKMTDARVQDVTEVLSVLRMVKLFGWERRMSQRLQERRNDELRAIWKLKVLESITNLATSIIPTITMVSTFATYTLIMQRSLTPSTLFSSMSVFSILRSQLYSVSNRISVTMQGKVSLDRLTQFLQGTELLDSLTETNSPINETVNRPPNRDVVGFGDATFVWYCGSNYSEGTTTPSTSRRPFRLRIKEELIFKPDCINLIVGPTGSGKTSILMALLGEMHFVPSSTESWFNLPRERGIAYAAQESWVQNATFRENILFGSQYDETRYRKVLYQCALERDLELFSAGDATEIGEKGITLSGGQKARVTLARAIYSNASILLLDDVLAALDVHTSVWIVNKCFRGDLVKGRTIILVTHNIPLLAPHASFIASVSQEGTIRSQGTDIAEILEADSTLAHEAEIMQQELEVADQEVPSLSKKEAPADGKLVVAEEIVEGHVRWNSYKLFFSSLGGNHAILFFFLWIGGFFLSDSIRTSQTWFLGHWGSQYETHDPSEVPVVFYLSLYTSIVLGTMLMNTAFNLLYVTGTMRASKRINTALIDSILSSTLRWLDETPTARIITRCTQDMRDVDGSVPNIFLYLTSIAIGMVINVGVIILFAPLCLIPGVAVAVLGLCLGNIYLKAQLSVKREMSNARSPVIGHLSAAITGIVSLRAYGVQTAYANESIKRNDALLRISRISYNLNRWISIRISILGSLFTMAVASYLVYKSNIGSANTGFTLALASEFCSMILWWVRFFNEFEVRANSLERIQGYIDIEHEPQPTEDRKPPAAWPTSGNIIVENLSARYSRDGPHVLHNISFRLESGQRVGIVGRTGSGKSSLTLALLRCILTEGFVYFDGILTDTLNLDALRSNITIIPQSPELISGTLRRNLDPFEEHDDSTLNDALHSAGLFGLQDEEGHARVTLDSIVSAGGSNLSVGEKQIIALARAMIRGSKLLILDEATSAIDYKTDAVIQATLRNKLTPDVTVITVAHRLQTIMDVDKIMVLEDGRLVEFDSPFHLLQKDGSLFKALVDESRDKESLYSMAKENRTLP